MSLDAARLQRYLKDGMAAARRRNFVRARELLLRVVAEAPDQVEAWWWLAQATDDPVEQMRALEHVLRLDPMHVEAQADLIAIRQERLGHQPAGGWERMVAAGAVEPSDELDDPFQCPACGRPTRPDDRKCRHCGRGLFWRMARGARPESVRSLYLLLAISVVAGLVELIGPLITLGLSRPHVPAPNFDWVEALGYVQMLLGDMTRLQPALAAGLLQVLAARALVLLATALGVRQRWAGAFYLAVVVALADLGLGGALLVMGWVGVLMPAVHIGLALAILLLLMAVVDDFAVSHQRILVRPDGGAHSALDFYQRGRGYSRQGLWALAVAQWRRAVGLAPRMPKYYRDLAIGLAQIGAFERSLRAIEQAQHLAPDDPDLGEIAQLVRTQAKTDTLLKM